MIIKTAMMKKIIRNNKIYHNKYNNKYINNGNNNNDNDSN